MAVKKLPPAPMSAADVAALAKLQIKPPKVDFQSGGANADVSFTAGGLESAVENLRNVPISIRNAAGFEMADILHEVIKDAMDNYVPFKTGALHDSGNADEWNKDENINIDIMKLAAWFGAPLSAIQARQAARIASTGEGEFRDPSLYAVKQHENTSYEHHPPPDLSGPKYLERPFVKIQNTIANRLANAAGVALGTQSKQVFAQPGESLQTIGERIRTAAKTRSAAKSAARKVKKVPKLSAKKAGSLASKITGG